jgi:hypothetical protein
MLHLRTNFAAVTIYLNKSLHGVSAFHKKNLYRQLPEAPIDRDRNTERDAKKIHVKLQLRHGDKLLINTD